MRPIYPNELYHYGVLGMKWGVRRYQNADGSLTAAGKAHYKVGEASKREIEKARRARKSTMPSPNQKTSTGTGKKIAKAAGVAAAGVAAAGVAAGAAKVAKKNPELFDQTIKGGKDKPNVSPAEQTARSTERTLESTQNALRAIQRIKNSSSESQSKKMTEEDLQKAIKRLELERRYDSLTANDTASGMSIAMDVIEITKDVAIAAGAVATAYAALKKLGV